MRYLARNAGLDGALAPDRSAPDLWQHGNLEYLGQFAGRDPALAAHLLGALGPYGGDLALDALAREARAGASRVFLLHGNVRDYAFHPGLGYARLPQVFAYLWRCGQVFGEGTSNDVILLSAAAGVELADAGAASSEVRKKVEDHRRAQRTRDHEERVQHDLGFVDELAQGPHPVLVLVERADLLFPATGDTFRSSNRVETVLRWGTRPYPSGWSSLVMLLTESPDDVHPELRKRINGVAAVELPRPRSAEERLRFLGCAIAAAAQYDTIALPATRITTRLAYAAPSARELPEIAAATTGLNLAGLEACLLTVPPGESLITSAVGARERLLRAESEGLLVVEEPRDVPLTGRLAELAAELDWLAQAMARGHVDAVPMGLLFVGVPGTGKSYLASALAARCRAAGVQYVRLGDFRDMWVGSTERNFSRALDLIATFGRCIVFMDEIDQSEGGNRGDSRHETSKRVFGKLLEFMSKAEHRGNVLWIAATNRPDQIDPAMVRPGRFDLIVKFAPPTAPECAAILVEKLRKFNVALDTTDATHLGTACAGRRLVGAEIELVVTEAARRSRRQDRTLDAALLEEVLQAFRDDYKHTDAYKRMEQECERFERFRAPGPAA